MTDWDVSVESQASPEDNRQRRWNPNIPYHPPAELPFSPREQVLHRAVETAVRNGWAGWRFHVNDAVTLGQEATEVVKTLVRLQKPVELLIFNHDFAKALWGTAQFAGEYEPWTHHLQQMVIADDRIKYLQEHL